ncbi:hypothetical protein PIB30_079640 [Stylosanthes scabra]|uniref:Uncharacterized protein n=1 Tax=Stylosanthes scabra TaxID=79078 RepID=A0ABU6YTW5_9FABA|nr:hypothetical protein [Stylosanthes scabra]
MARSGPPSTKGNAKAYGPPTQALHRLVALRSQSAANSYPEALVTPAILTPAIAKRTAQMSVKSYSMKLTDRGGPSNVAPTPSLPKKCPIHLMLCYIYLDVDWLDEGQVMKNKIRKEPRAFLAGNTRANRANTRPGRVPDPRFYDL